MRLSLDFYHLYRNNTQRLLPALITLLSAISAFQPAVAQYIGNASPAGVPRFHLSDGNTHTVGKGFAIQWFHNKTLFICPLHLLGPGGSYPVYIEARDVPEKVVSIDVMDLKEQSILASTGRGLLRSGTPVEKSRGDLSGDVMAFELQSGSRLPLLALAPTLVPVGTKVWVLGKNWPATTLEVERFAGTVTRSMPSGVTIQMDSKLTALACSGAPVVNAKNELVCMMVGKESLAREVVMGIPSTVIYARLCRELPPEYLRSR